MSAGRPGRGSRRRGSTGGRPTGGAGVGGANRGGTGSGGASGGAGLSSGSIDDWYKCVRALTVSSRESHALRLVDGTDSFWQSSGSQGRHWIRLEMQPDVVVERLFMRVDPHDSSYMPSVLVIRAGDVAGATATKELRTVNVSASENMITLLQDVQEVLMFCPLYYCVIVADWSLIDHVLITVDH